MPNLEFALLYLLTKSKEYGTLYIKIYDNILLSDELKRIYKYVLKYYKTYSHHDYISKDEFLTYFLSENPVLKQKDQYIDLINRIYNQDISESLASDVMRKYAAKIAAERICQHLMPVLDGSDPERVLEVSGMLDEYRETVKERDTEESPFILEGIEELFRTEVQTPGLTWPLDCLNNSIGPLRGGTLGHIFARVESGKTTLLAHIMTHMATQLQTRPDGQEEVILGVFNEDKGKRIKIRMYESALGYSEHDLQSELIGGRTGEVERRYKEVCGERIFIFYEPTATIEEIQSFLEIYPVRLLVVDIADHVKFRDASDKKVEFLEELYRRFRVMAGTYNCDVITVGQADASVAGKKTLFVENMNNSKTGKPGALDWAIGIGATYDPGEQELRWINVVKNKLNSEGGCGPFTVRIDKSTGRYYNF